MIKREKTKWELKRERLMANPNYAVIIRSLEADAETLHRIRLAMVVEKEQPGAAYIPIRRLS